MSGGLDGSDWWQASDGRWYPPETRPPEPTGAPEPDPAAGASIGPLASSLMAGGAQFTNAPFEPTAAAPATAPSGTPSTKAEVGDHEVRGLSTQKLCSRLRIRGRSHVQDI